MMTHAYDIAYLDDAMTSLGGMLDYAVNSCGEDLTLFYARFLGSGVAKAFSRANPKYLVGMSGIELATLVADRTGDELPNRGQFIDIGRQFATRRITEASDGDLLKRARKNARLTQRQLSDISGIPITAIRSYEQNHRSLKNAETENVWRICQALGCRIEDIRPLTGLYNN